MTAPNAPAGPRAAKFALERALVDLFDEFALQTGLVVSGVDILEISWDEEIRPRIHAVSVRAELP